MSKGIKFIPNNRKVEIDTTERDALLFDKLDCVLKRLSKIEEQLRMITDEEDVEEDLNNDC